MNDSTPTLSRANASFGLAAAICILVNTLLACAKDADKPLKNFMASSTGHDWTTQGLAIVLLFVVLGLIFQKVGWTRNVSGDRLASWLAGAAIVAGVVLFAWYALY